MQLPMLFPSYVILEMEYIAFLVHTKYTLLNEFSLTSLLLINVLIPLPLSVFVHVFFKFVLPTYCGLDALLGPQMKIRWPCPR